MAGYIAAPSLPQYDDAKTPQQNFEEMRRSLAGFFNSAVYAINDSVQRDGTRVFKAITTTLPAGTVQFEGRKMSVATNATFGGGAWRSSDTARPSWRYTTDMSLDRGTIERAAASTGNLSWSILSSVTSGGVVSASGGWRQLGAGGQAIRIVAGRVNGTTGAPQIANVGFASSRLSAGTYPIVFSTAFGTILSVTTGIEAGSNRSLNIDPAPTTTGFTAVTTLKGVGGAATDSDFGFIAIGTP